MAKKHKPEEIVEKLREARLFLALGGNVRDACLRIGVTEQTYQRWRKRYGDPQISDADRVLALRQENARLQEKVSDLTLDKQALRRKLNTLIFVGGAPRTGTTLLQALICTSPRTNKYLAECSYLTAFMEPYRRALGTWEMHTHDYFDGIEEMCAFHADVIRKLLSQFRKFLGGNEALVLKDPCLTEWFYTLAYLLPEAKFAVMIRDPLDAISSRLEVMERSTNVKPTLADIEYACAEYNGAYAELIQHWRHLGDRLILISYNALVGGKEFDRLAAFGLDEVQPEQLTQSTWVNAKVEGSPWNTDLYGGDLSAASVGRHQSFMEPETAKIIVDRCGDTAQSLFNIAADPCSP
jgi:transposase-like protein